MRIVDLRPWLMRRLTAAWRERAMVPASGAAWSLTRLADAWQARQAAARPAPTGAALVVSVGNLALGGTGKTPVTAQLASDLAAAGLRGAVVTRGYGSPLPGPLRVEAGTAGAGDEARLLAAALAGTGWLVVQARRRPRGVDLAARLAPGLDVLLLEDGHQTAGVGRHLDIVILDGWRSGAGSAGELQPTTGPVAPFGPWRESAAGAGRAGIWLLEGAPPLPTGPTGVAVAGFTRASSLGSQPPATARVALLSGIARPAAFEGEAVRELGRPCALAIRCRDHEPFGPRQLQRIDRLLAGAAIDAVVTTAKDAVKLKPVWEGRPPLHVLRQSVRWEGTTALPELVRERLDAVRRGIRDC